MRAARSGSSSCRTRITGTRRACRRSTRWCCCRCRRPNSRTSALLSGQVDWIEAAVARRHAAAQIGRHARSISNSYPHIWPYQPQLLEGSPVERHPRAQGGQPRDRPRRHHRAAGRPGCRPRAMCCPTARGSASPASTSNTIRTRPRSCWPRRVTARQAAQLKIAISASGSGQMLPLPMNEYVQQNLADVGFKLEFEVIEWKALVDRWRAGAKATSTRASTRSTSAMRRRTRSAPSPGSCARDLQRRAARTGASTATRRWTSCSQAAQRLRPAARNAALARIHEKIVNDALLSGSCMTSARGR